MGAVPVRAHRRLRPGRLPHPRRPGRRRVHPQRLQDLEHRGVRERLRDVPRPHGLGRAEAPRPHDVHREDPPARHPGRADQAGQRVHGVLPGVLRRRRPPAPTSVVGEVERRLDGGADAALHERNAVGGGSPYVSGRNHLAEGADGARRPDLRRLVAAIGAGDDPVARQLVAEAHVLDVVQRGLVRRVVTGMAQRDAADARPRRSRKLFSATSGSARSRSASRSRAATA